MNSKIVLFRAKVTKKGQAKTNIQFLILNEILNLDFCYVFIIPALLFIIINSIWSQEIFFLTRLKSQYDKSTRTIYQTFFPLEKQKRHYFAHAKITPKNTKLEV